MANLWVQKLGLGPIAVAEALLYQELVVVCAAQIAP
jgi:hypothetical protein